MERNTGQDAATPTPDLAHRVRAALTREVLDTTTMNDPHSIASEVLRRISKDDQRAALAECLPALVREMIRNSRNAFLHLPPAGPARSGPALVGRDAGSPAKSAKVAAIRAAGPRWLADRLNTGADPREWKRVGDCSFTDLMFAAGQRREQAARTSAVADRLEALAGLVRGHGVERVRDLPESVLAGVGGMAA